MASVNLTTRARVKERIDPKGQIGSDYDSLIDTLIAETSSRIETLCNRQFLEAVRTEYVDGTGRDTLVLRQGPLVTLTSINAVDYSDAGDGSQDETLTEVEAYEYVAQVLQSAKELSAVVVRRLNGVFDCGTWNYKVVYTAGYGTDTDDIVSNGYLGLVEIATVAVVMAFNNRESWGLISKSSGDSDHSPVPLANLDAWLVRSLGPYRLHAVG